MIIRKCKGCGALLQDEREEDAGFVPVLDNETRYCKRCFRMKHYNELPKIVATNEDYEHVIDSVIKKNGLIVFVVDIFAFKSTFNKKMIDKLRNKNVILVANKYDLFPKSTNISSIVTWLSRQCEKIFFRVDAIHVVSSKKGYFMEDLTNTIDLARKGRDVYFVGCANVGKSSLINALLKKNTSLTEDVVATSQIPGTTLNEIVIPFFDDNKAFIDTPGLINTSDVLNYILPKSYKDVIPNSEIKPITYQLTDQNAVFIGGLACLDFTVKERVSVIVYASNNMYIHRCKSSNVEHMFKTQLGKLLTPPVLEEVSKIKYVETKFNFSGKKKQDIWLSGFGFVSIIGDCTCKVTTIENTEVYVVDSIIG